MTKKKAVRPGPVEQFKRELNTQPLEFCPFCKKNVWSFALHQFFCHSVFSDLSEDDKKKLAEDEAAAESRTQALAKKLLQG